MLVEHHIKYKEIHGVDKTTWMTMSEHKLLHLSLRRNGKCNIPSETLRVISNKAHSRTKKTKEYRNCFAKKYTHDNLYQFMFKTCYPTNMRLIENLIINKKTGAIRFYSGFVGHHGIKLHEIYSKRQED